LALKTKTETNENQTKNLSKVGENFILIRTWLPAASIIKMNSQF
jgi:hypothetical protein